MNLKDQETSNRTFVERARRIDLSFPLRFLSENQAISGHCLNISASGLMANFEQELEVWTTGQLELSFAGTEVALSARVARCDERQAGLAFVFQSDAEREAIHMLVAKAAAQSTLAGGPAPF